MAFSCLIGSEIQVSNLERVIEADTCLLAFFITKMVNTGSALSVGTLRIPWVRFVDCSGTPPHFKKRYVQLTEDS